MTGNQLGLAIGPYYAENKTCFLCVGVAKNEIPQTEGGSVVSVKN